MTSKVVADAAKDLAGRYHGGVRTEVFRANWPSEYEFVDLNWPHFIAEARHRLSGLLGEPDVAEEDKQEILAGLLEEAKESHAMDAHTALQMTRDSPLFDGDKSENKRTDAVAIENGELHRAFKRVLNRSAMPKYYRWS